MAVAGVEKVGANKSLSGPKEVGDGGGGGVGLGGLGSVGGVAGGF